MTDGYYPSTPWSQHFHQISFVCSRKTLGRSQKKPIKRHCHVAIDGTFLQLKGRSSRFCGWEDEACDRQIRRTACCLGGTSGSCGKIVIS